MHVRWVRRGLEGPACILLVESSKLGLVFFFYRAILLMRCVDYTSHHGEVASWPRSSVPVVSDRLVALIEAWLCLWFFLWRRKRLCMGRCAHLKRDSLASFDS